MPHDFRSHDLRSGRASAQPIGFHELRQACEISALREDLERIVQEAGALRDSVEDAVEQVRARFAALTAEEMTDAAKMAPLLQFAVATLLDLREQARRMNTQTGPVSDDDRPSWMDAADAPRLRPTAPPPAPAAPPPVPAAPAAPAAPLSMAPAAPPSSAQPPFAPPPLSPLAPAAARPSEPRPAPTPPPAASWLNTPSAPPPAPLRSTPQRGGSSTAGGKGIDWLSPAGR